MEEIRWIQSIDCRSCALELRDAPRRKMERIREDRKHIPKCKDCPRLADAVKEAGLDGHIAERV
jgi:hypothetical protein